MVDRFTVNLHYPGDHDPYGLNTPEGVYPHLVETFDSVWEFYTEAKRLQNRPRIETGTERAARDGVNHDKVPSILDIVNEAIIATPELREVFTFSPEFDVAGDYVDMGRYMSGEPECMVYSPLQARKTVSPIITLVSSADANFGGEWTTRGMIATALAMALTRLGYSTEMWADNYGASYIGADRFQYQRIKVKSTTDELNPARMLFAFGEAAMLDELAYGCYDGFKQVGYPQWHGPFSTGGRGRAVKRTDAIKGLYPEGTIFITGDLQGDATPAQVAGVVVQELKGAGLIK